MGSGPGYRKKAPLAEPQLGRLGGAKNPPIPPSKEGDTDHGVVQATPER